MNIFILDKDPQKAATYHYDKHVVKMILESAQMLCTVANELGYETGYKSTHSNHPCTLWVKESRANFHWLWDLIFALEKEWNLRYNHTKRHKSIETLRSNIDIMFKTQYKLPDKDLTPFAQAMPECYQSDDAVESYRHYYVTDKLHLAKYTNREYPEWYFAKGLTPIEE